MAHPVGTGPFRLGQWTRTSRIVLERNPTYREEIYDFERPWKPADIGARDQRLRGKRVPLIDRVEVTIIQESQPRLLSFEQGALDHLLVPTSTERWWRRTESSPQSCTAWGET